MMPITHTSGVEIAPMHHLDGFAAFCRAEPVDPRTAKAHQLWNALTDRDRAAWARREADDA